MRCPRESGAVIGHFVDGITHDLGDRIDLPGQVGPCAIDRPVDRLEIDLRIAAFAEAHVDLHRAIAHHRTYAAQIREGEHLALERIHDEPFEFGRGRARQVRRYADLRKIELRQHLHRRVDERIARVEQHGAEHQHP